MGPNVDGAPEERIRRPQVPYDSGWLPASDIFYLDGNVIVDEKAREVEGWNTLPVGFVFDDFYHQNRMKIKNVHGEYEYFEFPDRHFRCVKSGSQTWQLQFVE